MMDKAFYKKCIEMEVYGGKRAFNVRNVSACFYRKHLYAPTNAVYLFRKMQFLNCRKDIISSVRVILLKLKLAKTYGILASEESQIDIGLKFVHPTSIVIGAHVVAGKNLALYQNTTLGGARIGDVKKGNQPIIGDNVTVFANSLILGKITVSNETMIGANSLLLKNTEKGGVYVGSPAILVQSQ